MIDLLIQKDWPTDTPDTAFEDYMAHLASILEGFSPTDSAISRTWRVVTTPEDTTTRISHNNQPIAEIVSEGSALHVTSNLGSSSLYDDLMYAIRLASSTQSLSVYSMAHGGSRLPRDYRLAIDHSYLTHNTQLHRLFASTHYIPRFCLATHHIGEPSNSIVVRSPYYVEDSTNNSIHLINTHMLDYLLGKEVGQLSQEFTLKVADSLTDFANKDDVELIPRSFYRYYGNTAKIINATDFDISTIQRKIFIDPCIWDYDHIGNYRYYANSHNGLHLMDSVQPGELLDAAIRRILSQMLPGVNDYVGARVFDIEFDRDSDGLLTPRLKINVYVHGLNTKQSSQDHNWVSLK